MAAAIPLTQAEFTDLLHPMKPDGAEQVAVAVSGGADSLALTLMLGDYCRANDISLTAVTVDHGLRPESAEEARTVGGWLETRGISHVILSWQGDKPHSNIQDQARLARYRLMGEWAQKNDITKLFLAHHQGDQAETFLIRLFRGSGIDGLSAMKAQAEFPYPLPGGRKITICRPLLDVAKDRLEATLSHCGQAWIEDPSNQNDAYMRIKVRNLLKQNDIKGLDTERMAGTAARMARVQSLLQCLSADLTNEAVTIFPEGYAEVKRSLLLSAHEEIALRCLASLTRRISGGKYAPRLARLEALYERLQAAEFSGQTVGGCLVSPLKDGRIMISREASAIEDGFALAAHRELLWDGRFYIENRTIAGVLTRLGVSQWQSACGENPGLKKLKLLKLVRDCLPCIVSDSGKVILPDFIRGFEKTGFKTTFK